MRYLQFIFASLFIVLVGCSAGDITGLYQYFEESDDGLLFENGEVITIFEDNETLYLTVDPLDEDMRFPITVDGGNYQVSMGIMHLVMTRENGDLVGTLSAGADEEPIELRYTECSSCEDPAEAARAFNTKWAANDFESITPLVESVFGLEDRMQQSTFSPDEEKIGLPDVPDEIEVGDYAVLDVPFDVEGGIDLPTYVVRVSEERYVVDWQATVGHNSLPLSTRLASPPTEASPLRVYASLSSYYNYDFGDAQDTHYSISIEDEQGDFANAYVEKDSDTGRRLYEILSDGDYHRITIHATNYFTRDSSIFELQSLISEDWRVD